MYNYIQLPHTADVQLEVTADTMQECFQGSLEALCSIISPDFNIESSDFVITEELNMHSVDRAALFIDFLNSVLSLMQRRKIMFSKINFIELTEKHIVSELIGGYCGEFTTDVKAVTYHEATIKQQNNKYISKFILDI